MIHTDADALLCDMAETYGIYSLQDLPQSTVAVLAAGLGPNSRIVKKITGQKASRFEMLLAAAVDRLSLLVYAQTEDAKAGINKPPSILDQICGNMKEDETPLQEFATGEEFARAWRGGG